MNTIPKRRGRRPNAEVAAQNTIAVPVSEDAAQKTESVPPSKRRRRASVGGFNMKLAIPQRAGFVRRWFNDTPGRIAEAEDLAYDHVKEEGIKSDSPDSRVRRLVGTQANGQPLYAYLMETPKEEYRAGQDEKEEQHRLVDKAISEGRDATGRISNGYGEGSIRSG